MPIMPFWKFIQERQTESQTGAYIISVGRISRLQGNGLGLQDGEEVGNKSVTLNRRPQCLVATSRQEKVCTVWCGFLLDQQPAPYFLASAEARRRWMIPLRLTSTPIDCGLIPIGLQGLCQHINKTSSAIRLPAFRPAL